MKCHCFVSRVRSLRQKVRLRTGQISSVKENGDQRKASGVNVMKNIVKAQLHSVIVINCVRCRLIKC